MLTDSEYGKAYPDRNNPGVPADEQRDIQAALHAHVYDPAAVRALQQNMPQGASEGVQSLVEIGKAIETANRYRRPEQGVPRKTLQFDQLMTWTEVPGTLSRRGRVSPLILRAMADQDPLIQSILQNKINRSNMHTTFVESGIQAMLEGLKGFDIVSTLKKPWDALSEGEERERHAIKDFILNMGDVGRFGEGDKPNRDDLGRESFPQVMSQLVRQRFVIDAIAIEIQRSLNRKKISGLYVVDGASIMRTDPSEWGYLELPESIKNPNARYVQVWRNQIVTSLGSEDLAYYYANPRDAIGQRGYGISETEISMKLTTGILNVLSTNNALFDRSALPPGILTMFGQVNQNQMLEMSQEWDAYRGGAGGQWGFPMINIRDPQGKLQYLRTDGQPSEMVFSAYVNFLAAIRCAIFGVDVNEINVSPFGGNNSGLNSGKDHQSRVDETKNRSHYPFMSMVATIINEIIAPNWGGRWRFTWVGLQQDDPAEMRKVFQANATVDEVRQTLLRMPPIGGIIGGSLSNSPALAQMNLAAIKDGAIDANGDGQINASEVKSASGKQEKTQ